MVTYHSHSKFIIYIVVYSMGLEKCVMTYFHHKESYRVFLLLLKSSQSFPGGSAGKESTCNAGYLGLIPGLGRFPEEGKGYPLRYSGLENSMDNIVHELAKSPIQLSHFHFHFSLKSICTFNRVFIDTSNLNPTIHWSSLLAFI